MTARILNFLVFSAAAAYCADPALTIYNQNFAVVRESVPLDLKKGAQNVQFQGEVTPALQVTTGWRGKAAQSPPACPTPPIPAQRTPGKEIFT